MIEVHESKQVIRLASSLAADIQSLYPGLHFHFIVHRRGQRQDEIEKLLGSLNGHPAYDAARDMLRARPSPGENSSFLGIAVGHERGLFGLKGRPACLSFIALNLDQYESRDEAQYALFHMVGQFFELMGILKPDSLKASGDIILQPRRNTLSLARSNMKADIFSALMMTTEGRKDAPFDLARWRGMQSLTPQTPQRPEEYPYAISLDVTQFAVTKISEMPGTNLLKFVYHLSHSASRTFGRDNFESWLNFANPAQTMAWSGHSPDQILGAAIHSSPNPFIKSIGNLLAEVTQIDPVSKQDLQGYNPYVDMEINQIAHERQVEDTFEMVMIHSLEADSHLPMVRVANNQNESMAKGKVFGWCAHALHAAAKAYDSARQRGVPPVQAARLEFESAKQQTNWNTLDRLKDHIIGQHRRGFAVTLEDIASWCKTSVDFRPVVEAIQYTLADPGYTRKLAAANEMPMPVPTASPRAPQPSMNALPAFATAPQFGLGGMGGGMMGIRTQTTRTAPAEPPISEEE